MAKEKSIIFFYQDGERKRTQQVVRNLHLYGTSMLQYFQEELDPICLKYAAGISLSTEGRKIAAEYQSTHYQYSSITKQEYSGILDNLRLVYGQDSAVENDIKLFHTVETKLLCGYFGLPQLNQMFDEDYFNFEWDMHVGQNYSEHRSDYYRDHFIHQIRDLYMIFRLLKDAGFYKASEHILRDPSASKVSEYVFKKSMTFCHDRMGTQQQHLKGVFQSCFPGSQNIDQKQIDEYIESFFFKYVVYASSMMAALFHDMGYPICHFLDVRRRISAYNPTMYMFTHNAVESFDQLSSKLGSSLLFAVVSPSVVRKRLETGKEGRYDHGAYSAVAFLLQFYDTGVIHSLSAEKQCAIELAALAIFNHTSKFKALKPKADTSYYNMYFQQNPVSFLLRFCDDLQEWDRRYFEISKAGDLLFCPKCGYPLMKRTLNNDLSPKSRYECRCQTGGTGLLRPDVFNKRKVYLVSVADWVRVSSSIVEEQPALVAKINYDPYKLLMLAKTNPTYARYRASELKELKRLLADQDFSLMTQNELSFSRIYLDYFMTPNPILIKLKILEIFLRRAVFWDSTCGVDELISTGNLKDRLAENRTLRAQSRVFSDICNSVFTAGAQIKDLLRFLKGTRETKSALAFYYYLLRDCLTSAKDKEAAIPSTDVDNYLAPFKLQDPQYYEIMSVLIRDCMKQYKKKMEDTSAYIADDEEAGFYQCVKCYTDDHNYFNLFDAKPVKSFPYIGYFNDIFFFYRLYEQFWKTSSVAAVESC